MRCHQYLYWPLSPYECRTYKPCHPSHWFPWTRHDPVESSPTPTFVPSAMCAMPLPQAHDWVAYPCWNHVSQLHHSSSIPSLVRPAKAHATTCTVRIVSTLIIRLRQASMPRFSPCSSATYSCSHATESALSYMSSVVSEEFGIQWKLALRHCSLAIHMCLCSGSCPWPSSMHSCYHQHATSFAHIMLVSSCQTHASHPCLAWPTSSFPSPFSSQLMHMESSCVLVHMHSVLLEATNEAWMCHLD